MTIKPEKAKAELIERLINRACSKIPSEQGGLIKDFIQGYYDSVAPENLQDFEEIDLYGAVFSQWNFCHDRKPDQVKVRVYNPSFERHGWQSTHTVIEVLLSDMPFLVDSLGMELNRRGWVVHQSIHPVIRMKRNQDNQLVAIAEDPQEGFVPEAVVHFQVDRQTEDALLEDLKARIHEVLDDVRVAVDDWQKMRAKLDEYLGSIEKCDIQLAPDDLAESKDFLRWIEDNHFTFLGIKDYQKKTGKDGDTLVAVKGSGLGLMRDSRSFAEDPELLTLSVSGELEAGHDALMVLAKSSQHATVHRPVQLDFMGLPLFDESGAIVGERHFFGLYTSAAYNRDPRRIPYIRRKVNHAFERSGFLPVSHDGKALLNIIETFPRDELFQMDAEPLFQICLSILHLQTRQRVRLFARRERYGRFLSCLVFVPREHYDTSLRKRMQEILLHEFEGESAEYTAQVSESALARIHFVIRTDPGQKNDIDIPAVEKKLIEAARSWQDQLREAMLDHFGEERGNKYFRYYGTAFPSAYREDYSARSAVLDIDKISQLHSLEDICISLYRPLEAPEGILHFKLARMGQPVPLSGTLPMLENMGVKVISENPYKLKLPDDKRVWIHDFGMRYPSGLELELSSLRSIFQEAFSQVWRNSVESDGFNQLVLLSNLSWREVVILRAYSKYLRQVGMTFSQTYVEQTLAKHAKIVRALIRLFDAKFNPASKQRSDTDKLEAAINKSIDSVVSLDEDRILRRYLNIVQVTLRTNYYQRDAKGNARGYLSFKLDPRRITDLPLPRPMFEIFVYSPRVEGVHLRGGKVARGGLRWSDRREDFRTEVLGLMKAQMVKNTVIVPVGAKGGFVVKEMPAGNDRKAIMDEVVECYSTFIRGMLDITDNIINGKIIPPSNVVRLDEDDPYLVVAADKGTATFSDIANGISHEYGFWLDDAFASGGSVGYDHKKMAITAKGGWESVKRHFRELGRDIQKTDFTVIGIGGMAGDVFGNGMLLSPHIKLIGSFTHIEIFLDPDPNPAVSFKERKRLFDNPELSWTDYNPKLISKGGGVFSRSAKSVELSPEAQKMLGVAQSSMTPNEVIRQLLRVQADLLWNGGIGTYVKASTESHLDVGDKSNDMLRLDGRDLQVRVVGEGGNLGLTQLGRIEFARSGGRINADFIDNSGGVDCSDREVNIKILLNAAVAAQDMTEKQRNKLLLAMKDEVADLVLMDNYRQTRAISASETTAAERLDEHTRFMDALERASILNKDLEGLPNVEQIGERQKQGKGLTRPELSVLLSYAKIVLYSELLETDVPEDAYLSGELEKYFPTPLREDYADLMQNHRLKREIIATQITNSLINRMGITFVHQLGEETGSSVADIARAYAAARQIFDMRESWLDTDSLDNKVASSVQIAMMLKSVRLTGRATHWFLRNCPTPLNISELIKDFCEAATELSGALRKLLSKDQVNLLDAEVTPLLAAGVPKKLAQRIADMEHLYSAMDISRVARESGYPTAFVARCYFNVGDTLELYWLKEKVIHMQRQGHWQNLAHLALQDDLYSQHAALVGSILQDAGEGADEKTVLVNWFKQNSTRIEHWHSVLSDMKASMDLDFSMLSVALREIRTLSSSSK